MINVDVLEGNVLFTTYDFYEPYTISQESMETLNKAFNDVSVTDEFKRLEDSWSDAANVITISFTRKSDTKIILEYVNYNYASNSFIIVNDYSDVYNEVINIKIHEHEIVINSKFIRNNCVELSDSAIGKLFKSTLYLSSLVDSGMGNKEDELLLNKQNEILNRYVKF